jgi:Asp-tRNA(Asn)/Glu-tRNA(Gln) amidotransferase A subunit family amidase
MSSSTPGTAARPFSKALFLRSSILALRKEMAAGRLSASELAEECIRQVGKIESSVRAWEVFDAELLRAQAAASDSIIDDAPLRGIPVGVKDIYDTVDFPTQMGSPIWKGFRPGHDARAVFHLRRAGAVLPGKTVTAEFAVHALNATRNPHDASVTPGTSSSGSAAAVATGMVPAALGTQTAGSIVRPASFCGVYGCKPSFGTIPRTGMLKTTDSLDTVGYFVSQAEDLARLFDVLRVHGANYPFIHRAYSDAARQAAPSGRPWRLAFCRTPVWKHAESYAKAALDGWVKSASADSAFKFEELDLPAAFSEAHEIHATIYNKTLSYYFQEESKRAELISPVMMSLIASGAKTSLAQFQSALAAQVRLARELDAILSRFDALVCLSTAGEAPAREVTETPDSALIWTLCHLPIVSAPAFVSPRGLPFGLQLSARRYNDYRLFRLVDVLRARGLIPEGPNPAAPGL